MYNRAVVSKNLQEFWAINIKCNSVTRKEYLVYRTRFTAGSGLQQGLNKQPKALVTE